MEAIEFLTNWVDWLLILIPGGAGLRIAYIGYKKTHANEGENIEYNKKIFYTLKAAIIAECIPGIVVIFKSFYL